MKEHMTNEELLDMADIFEKTAEHIESLEESIEKKAVAEQVNVLSEKLAGFNLDEEDLENIRNLPGDTLSKLEKIASFGIDSTSPEIMGQAGGMNLDDTDAFTQFLLSDS